MKHLTEFFKTSLTPKNNKRGTVCRGQVPVETNRPSKKNRMPSGQRHFNAFICGIFPLEKNIRKPKPKCSI